MTADGRWHTWAEQKMMPCQPPHHTFKDKVLTCLAATFEDPTTLPLLSITSIPSESSLCLIKATLQMLAVAADSENDSLCRGNMRTRGRYLVVHQADRPTLWNPPTAGKGTNLCMMVLLAGLNLLAFLIRMFSPTYQTHRQTYGNAREIYL